MVFKNFEELTARVRGSSRMRRVAVVAAEDEHSLEAALRGRDAGIAEPILVGRRPAIEAVLERLGASIDAAAIIDAPDERAAAAAGVALVASGRADFLMKGRLQTADLLRAVVDKTSGLRSGGVMSHIAVDEIPGHHKLVFISDGGMLTYPDLAQKRAIIENAVGVLMRFGYSRPKVAVLAAVETVNEKMSECVDAAELKRLNADGWLSECVVEGPISYDLAMSAEAAQIKGYSSPVAGDADILVVPSIAAGNILGKCLIYSAGARMAGLVVGAAAPIVLTSRGASADEKFLSLVIAAAAAGQGNAAA